MSLITSFFFFFFNDTATTEIYTLSLHDALPILWRAARTTCARCRCSRIRSNRVTLPTPRSLSKRQPQPPGSWRSEEHTSELQSLTNLVCRLLLEKKKKNNYRNGRTSNVRTSSRY